MKTFIDIIRMAGESLVRVPLLWLFSVVVLVTSDFLYAVEGSSLWLNCLALILIPITILAQVGQIRSIQLYRQGIHTSISEIIQYSKSKIGPLIAVWVMTTLMLTLILAGLLLLVFMWLLPLTPFPNRWLFASGIAVPIGVAFMAFAQRAIVISDLPTNASIPMVLRVLQKYPLPVATVVVVFGLLRYFVRIPIPLSAYSPAVIAGVLLVLLLLEGVQSAMYTFTYIHFAEEPEGGATVVETAA